MIDRDRQLKDAFNRLLLCNRVRELAAHSLPVTLGHLRFFRTFFAFIVWLYYGRGSSSDSKKGILIRALVFPLALLSARALMILSRIINGSRIRRFTTDLSRSLYSLNFLKDLDGIVRIGYWRIRYGITSTTDITGYVNCSEKEEPLIRVCMLLRTLRSYGSAVELALKRLESGMPDHRAREFAAFALREIGDESAATAISATAAPQTVKSEKIKVKLKYSLVMPAMFNSDVFQASLLSLLNSDYAGDIIVVEEGNHKEKVCENFCRKLAVKYIKNPEWQGVAAALDLGIKSMPEDTDVVIYAHSDVLWPPDWFSQLDLAWEKTITTGKVALINLGYMQVKSDVEAILHHAFVTGKYDDLLSVMTAMKEVTVLADRVDDVQIKDKYQLFGLAMDPWNNNFTKIRMMTGRFSVGVSFPMRTCKAIKIDTESSIGVDLELLMHALQNKKWSLWVNNKPLIHLVSSDTQRMKSNEKRKFEQDCLRTYELFPKKYGWEIEHFLFTYFAETNVIYFDEIVKAVNSLRFSDIDYIFDDFFDRLKNKKCSSCELVWCNDRKKCKYHE